MFSVINIFIRILHLYIHTNIHLFINSYTIFGPDNAPLLAPHSALSNPTTLSNRRISKYFKIHYIFQRGNSFCQYMYILHVCMVHSLCCCLVFGVAVGILSNFECGENIFHMFNHRLKIVEAMSIWSIQ